MNIQSEIKNLIQQIGSSRINGAAYDTAWVAQLKELDKPMAENALVWLRENQMANGCWGSKIPYHHDRLICTLAAMIALTRWGNDKDKLRVQRARLGLDMAINSLSSDISGATVGFELIVPLLLDEAYKLGAIQRRSDKRLLAAYPYPNRGNDNKRREDVVIDRLMRGKAKKLASLPDGVINRSVTTAFSTEMVGANGQHLLDVENLQEANGSVACSPSATAYFVLQVRPGDKEALDYLRSVSSQYNLSGGGGIPEFTPFDTYEVGWVLWNLALANALDAEMKKQCNPHLDFLVDSWIPGRGVGFAADYTPTDGDDTSMLYEVLSRYGRDVDLDAVLSYEQDDHFRCYDLELNPSVGVNIHVLGALREAGYEEEHPSVQKVIEFLDQNRVLNTFWVDKWHVSPYYATAHMIIAVAGFVDGLVENTIDWIIDTQKDNGAWGYYGVTAEETAYCLQALFIWQQYGGSVPRDVLKRGLDWLFENAEPPYEAFWVCKCLYTPELIVRSIVLSALELGSYL